MSNELNLSIPIDTDKYSIDIINENYNKVDGYMAEKISEYNIYNINNIPELTNGMIIDIYTDKWYNSIKDKYILLHNWRTHNPKKYKSNLRPGVNRLLWDSSLDRWIKLNVELGNIKPEDVVSGEIFSSNYGRNITGTLNKDDYYINTIPKNKVNISENNSAIVCKEIEIDGDCDIQFIYGHSAYMGEYIYIRRKLLNNNAIIKLDKFLNIVAEYNTGTNEIFDISIKLHQPHNELIVLSLNNEVITLTSNLDEVNRFTHNKGKLLIIDTNYNDNGTIIKLGYNIDRFYSITMYDKNIIECSTFNNINNFKSKNLKVAKNNISNIILYSDVDNKYYLTYLNRYEISSSPASKAISNIGWNFRSIFYYNTGVHISTYYIINTLDSTIISKAFLIKTNQTEVDFINYNTADNNTHFQYSISKSKINNEFGIFVINLSSKLCLVTNHSIYRLSFNNNVDEIERIYNSEFEITGVSSFESISSKYLYISLKKNNTTEIKHIYVDDYVYNIN